VKKNVAVFAAIALCASQAIAINKCKAPDGRVTFQEIPCSDSDHATTMMLALPPPGSSLPPNAGSAGQQAAAEADSRIAIRAAINERRPAIGMNLGELEQALGQPQRVNTSTTSHGMREQRVYDSGDPEWHVYVVAGRVTSYQSSWNGKKKVVCPSALEIRNVETSASSLTLNDAQRRQFARQLNEMRSCGK